MSRLPRLQVPSALKPGARIAVVAPASRVRRELLEAGIARLESWGYEVLRGRHLLARAGDLAGDDPRRLEDLNWALESSGIDAVWAARGGWGTPRLLGRLRPKKWFGPARWVIGFSDLTPLFALRRGVGQPSLHAPLVVDLADPARFVASDLRSWLTDPLSARLLRVATRNRLVGGQARGELVGGCLSMLTATLATRWQTPASGRVLFVEEVAEPPYKVDRMLWQLRQSGALRGLRALLLGHFTRCEPGEGRASRSLWAVLREHAEALGVPTLAGIPVGHGPRTRCLPMGYVARVDADEGRVEFSPR